MSIGSSWHGENYLQDIATVDEDGNVHHRKESSTAFTPSGTGKNISMMQVDAYIDKERDRLDKARANAMALRMEISAAINAVEDARYRDLLSAHYISLIPLEVYAPTVPCSAATVYRWRNEALNCIFVPEK